MRGGTVGLAKEFLERGLAPDIVLATDMLDLATFQALTRGTTAKTPFVVYFHENQLLYPPAPRKRQPTQLALTNITSALAADKVLFNSHFHMNAFLETLPAFLQSFPDYQELWLIDAIQEKSTVCPVGLELPDGDRHSIEEVTEPLVLLWNHRWSHDKQPAVFIKTLYRLQERGADFRLIVTGEKEINPPQSLREAQEKLAEHIIHFGYVADRAMYLTLLRQSDVMISTANQEFFGISTIEAIHAGNYPLLPNRLNYPALIPKPLHDQHLYYRPHHLLNRLTDLCSNPKLVRAYAHHKQLRDHIRQFSWQRVAPQYEAIFHSFGSR